MRTGESTSVCKSSATSRAAPLSSDQRTWNDGYVRTWRFVFGTHVGPEPPPLRLSRRWSTLPLLSHFTAMSHRNTAPRRHDVNGWKTRGLGVNGRRSIQALPEVVLRRQRRAQVQSRTPRWRNCHLRHQSCLNCPLPSPIQPCASSARQQPVPPARVTHSRSAVNPFHQQRAVRSASSEELWCLSRGRSMTKELKGKTTTAAPRVCSPRP